MDGGHDVSGPGGEAHRMQHAKPDCLSEILAGNKVPAEEILVHDILNYWFEVELSAVMQTPYIMVYYWNNFKQDVYV